MHLAHWKASEFRSFLLFYSLPCLWQILPEEYFQHFLLLVEAIWLLDQSSIPVKSIERAGLLLRHFCLRVEALYDSHYQTFNCLLHLEECVHNLGPLWSFSCFWYEDYNGDTRKLFHGTRKVQLQIAFAVCVQQKIPSLIPLLPEGSASNDLYKHMTQGTWKLQCKQVEIAPGIFAMGVMAPANLIGNERTSVESYVGSIKEATVFSRVNFRDSVIHSQKYHPVTRRRNFTVFVKDRGYLHVKYYLMINKSCPNVAFCHRGCVCRKPVYVAVGVCLSRDEDTVLSKDQFTHATVNHIVPLKREATEKVIVFSILDIQELCVEVDCGKENVFFVCLLPNRYERD